MFASIFSVSSFPIRLLEVCRSIRFICQERRMKTREKKNTDTARSNGSNHDVFVLSKIDECGVERCESGEKKKRGRINRCTASRYVHRTNLRSIKDICLACSCNCDESNMFLPRTLSLRSLLYRIGMSHTNNNNNNDDEEGGEEEGKKKQ